MTFVLSPQLDSGANSNLHWELYKSYLENNRKDLPESVFETISNPNWEGGSNSNSPYMSNVKSFAITKIGTTESHGKLVLIKGGYLRQPIEIEIEYSGLLDIDLPNSGGLIDGFAKTWRYHQFLVCDAWSKYEVEGKFFTHQIEFVGGLVWSISASRIQANWCGT